MNEKRMITKKQAGKTDWNALKLMSEEAMNTAAMADRDAPLLSNEQLKQFKKVHTTQDADVKLIRQQLNLSQDEFAHYFGVSVRTLQEWEQHRRRPNAMTRNFLKVISLEPRAVLRALNRCDSHSAR